MTLTDVVNKLRENDHFLILTHIRPDGDTVGSGAALCNALQKCGKTAWLYNNPQFNDCYPWLSDGFIAPAGYEGKFIIAVDMADVSMFPKGFEGRVDLCIDHHPSNTGYAAQTLVEYNKASCGEIVMKVIKELCGSLDKDIADQLYVAVSTDCGCFVYGNTNADTHRAAAELCDAGASNTALNKILFRTSTKARLALEGMIFSSLRYFHGGKTVVSIVTKEMLINSGAAESDCNDLASLPGRVEGSANAVLIRENGDNSCKVSLRTNGEVNASNVCSKFGGGGHAMAAGCSIAKPCEGACAIIVGAIAGEIK